VPKKRRFFNEISASGLARVRTLVELVRDTTELTPTLTLLRHTGFGADLQTGRGVLKMLEVLGIARSMRGKRKEFLWSSTGLGERCRKPQHLAFREMRDLLQYYRGSVIGTPDLMRDVGITDRHEALGALKTLHVLGCVEIGRLDLQTIGWKWVHGQGQSRTYQRGYFDRQVEAATQYGSSFEPGAREWPWMDAIIHREWSLRDEAAGSFTAVAENDGIPRYRPTSIDEHLFKSELIDALCALPLRLRQVVGALIVRGLRSEEAADVIGVSVSTIRRDCKRALSALRSMLSEAGYSPTEGSRHRTSGIA
jgi:hypothetical protein